MVTSIFNQQTRSEEQIFGLQNTLEPSKAGVQTLQILLKIYIFHFNFHLLLLLASLTQAKVTALQMCLLDTWLLTGVAMNHLEQHNPWSPHSLCGWLEIKSTRSFLYPVHINPIYILFFLYPLSWWRCTLSKATGFTGIFGGFGQSLSLALTFLLLSHQWMHQGRKDVLNSLCSCHYDFLQGYYHVLFPTFCLLNLG